MNDIGNALRSLPRTKASPRFTEEVLRAVREGERRATSSRLAWRLASAAAVLVLVAGLSVMALVQRAHHNRLEALRAEHQRIESDMQRVKAMADEMKPVLVLENGDTRVIVEAASNPNQQSTTPVYY